ncbi:MAG: hypothetical protein FWC26_06440 [Fibromonadales bacterium]|nr:hypothetical protein [Fibromonadales bacterium]
MLRFFLPAVFLVLAACEKNNDRDFALVYAELRIAEGEYGRAEAGKAIRFQILQKHGLSAEDFEKKIEEIKKEPQRWRGFQDNLLKILDSVAKEE